MAKSIAPKIDQVLEKAKRSGATVAEITGHVAAVSEASISLAPSRSSPDRIEIPRDCIIETTQREAGALTHVYLRDDARLQLVRVRETSVQEARAELVRYLRQKPRDDDGGGSGDACIDRCDKELGECILAVDLCIIFWWWCQERCWGDGPLITTGTIARQ